VVSDLHAVWSICFVNFHACMTYGLMFWIGDTGGIEIIWDYSNNHFVVKRQNSRR
jgi:Zn-finger protein